MWVWIVSWCLVTVSPIYDFPEPDIFHRSYKDNMVVVGKDTTYDCGHKRIFMDYYDANRFYDKARSVSIKGARVRIPEALYQFEDRVDSVRMDKIFVEDMKDIRELQNQYSH